MDDQPPRKRPSFTAVLGMGIALIVGVIGWLIAPGVLAALPSVAGSALPLAVERLLFAGVVLLLALILFGLAAALIAPGDPHASSEAHVERERDALRRRQKAARDQARKGKGRTP